MKICRNVLSFSRISLALAAALVVGLMAPATLHATPVSYTYDFDLTASPSYPYSGTGSFTVTSAIPSSGLTTYYGGSTLTALNFSIDGQSFSLSQNPTAFVETLNGALYDITFAGTDGSGMTSFNLQTSGLFAFYYHNAQGELREDAGTLDNLQAAPAAVTPEPSSLILLGTGLVGIAGATRRRFLKA